jgi:hypothetical protein
MVVRDDLILGRAIRILIILYYSDQLFTNFAILVSEKGRKINEKFPFDLWRILNASSFPGCDV